jgi:hypothetical protein
LVCDSDSARGSNATQEREHRIMDFPTTPQRPPETRADWRLTEQVMTAGTESDHGHGDGTLVIDDLDKPALAFPAWTYCG